MKKMSGNDAFERTLRETLETYEVPYNSADWSQLEARMDQGQSGPQKALSGGLYALLLGGSLAVASAAYVMFEQTEAGGLRGPGSLPTLMDEVTVAGTDTETGAMEYDQMGDFAEVRQQGTKGSDVADASPRATASPMVSPTRSRKAARPAETPDRSGEPVPSGAKTPADVAMIKATVTEGCPGTTIEFAMVNMPEDGIYLWNFGDGNFSNKPKPSHTFSKAGTYEVMLSHSSTNGGKFANKPVSDRIVIHEVPEAGFQFTKRDDENTIPTVHFENRSIGGRSFHWDFGDGTTSTVPHPTHVYKKQGTYAATLTVTNSNGCTDHMERTIRIDSDYDLLATKTFSPNGDGMEDTFIPEALLSLGVKFHLSIFDARTGDLLYETTDPQRPWNGKIGNRGEPCSPGDYLWMVEMKDGEKLGGSYNGSVSLVR